MSEAMNPAAPHHLPGFITAPGETDVLMVVMAVFLVVAVLAIGLLFLRMHTLPERIAHKGHKLQFEIVAVLGLLALFTHVHLFWVIGLLLALIDIPDFGGALGRMAGSLEKIAGIPPGRARTTCPTIPAPSTLPTRASRRSPPTTEDRSGDAEGADPCLSFFSAPLLTIFPDYLFRRYVQGKRIGQEITLYSVWFELRWGIIACLMLTIGLITVIFYNHPSTTNATLFYRTVPILPETNGRVAEVYRRHHRRGQTRRADLPARQRDPGGGGGNRPPQDRRGRRRPGERAGRHRCDRGQDPGGQELLSAGPGRIRDQAGAEPAQLRHRGAARDRAAAESSSRAAEGAVAAATAAKDAAEARISTLLPAEKASAEAALAQAEVELEKTVVRAGVTGVSSSSPCGWATSSTRSCGRPGS